MPFPQRDIRYRDLPPEKQLLQQLARFFHSKAGATEAALGVVDRVADKLFVSRPHVAEARGLLSEIRWRSMSEGSTASRLGRCPDATVEVMLRAVFEALRSGPACAHEIEATSIYHFNAECRRLMARLPAFRSWLALDFFVVSEPGVESASRFVRDILRMLDGELSRLVKAGYIAGDTATRVPYRLYLHRSMPHLGFLVVEFPERPEVLELNQSTSAVVGEFAYAGEDLVRVSMLPVDAHRPSKLESIPDISTRCTKVALARLARHLFLAVDDTAQPIDEIYERVFVTCFFAAAVPGTHLGHAAASPFEQRKWQRDTGGPTAAFDFEPPFTPEFRRTHDWYATRDWDDLVRDPSPRVRVVRPFEGQGIDPTLDGCRNLFYTHVYWTRRLLLGWYADRLVARRAGGESLVFRSALIDESVKNVFLCRSETPDGSVSFWQSDEVHGVAIMDTDVYFFPEPEEGTVRVVVAGALKPEGGPRSGHALRPVEVRLPMRKN